MALVKCKLFYTDNNNYVFLQSINMQLLSPYFDTKQETYFPIVVRFSDWMPKT